MAAIMGLVAVDLVSGHLPEGPQPLVRGGPVEDLSARQRAPGDTAATARRGIGDLGGTDPAVDLRTRGVHGSMRPEVPSGPKPTRGPLASPCNPLSSGACALPYPSNVWTESDDSSPTGIRVRITDDIMDPQFLGQLPASVHPSAIFDGKTGFSAAGPILFELDRAFDLRSLPPDGGDVVRVWDVTTGKRVPIHAERDHQAFANPDPGHVLRVWPVTRFEYRHLYLAVLTDGLQATDGSGYDPPAGVVEALSGQGSLGQRFRWVVKKLGDYGVDLSAVQSFTAFTVRVRGEVEAPMRLAVEAASKAPHPVKISATLPGLLPSVGSMVLGKVQLTDFRTDHDGHFAPEQTVPGEPIWADFILLLPASPRALPAPVVVYGHGITATKETGLPFGFVNAAQGWATIMIDQPNHGTRSARDGGNILGLPSPKNSARLVAIPAQSAVDTVSVIRAIQTSLADLDVLPLTLRPDMELGATGDGKPDLDPDRIIYQGTSMGGVLGTVPLAVAPDLDGGILHVGGVGIMHILVNSLVWDSIGFDNVLPTGGSGAEAAVAIAAIQFLIDPGDGINYADLWDTPWYGGSPRPVLHIYGLGDAIVPNYSTKRLSYLTGMPLLAPVREEIPGLEVTETFSNGNGLYQIPRAPGPAELAGFMAHLSFTDPRAVKIQSQWLREARESNTWHNRPGRIQTPLPLLNPPT
ncbi:MAG: hypothetical protein DYH08_00415 [Actinobacteria bacterium ATB1]|nr:hypothetical protein [Actinobacteria bacterium ATB1]